MSIKNKILSNEEIQFLLQPIDLLDNEYTQRLMRLDLTQNCVKEVAFLLEHGADINKIDENKQTLLVKAAKAKNEAVFLYLLDNDAQLGITENDMQTSFEYALQLKQSDIINILFKKLSKENTNSFYKETHHKTNKNLYASQRTHEKE